MPYHKDPFEMPQDLINFILSGDQAHNNLMPLQPIIERELIKPGPVTGSSQENPCVAAPPIPERQDDNSATEIAKKLQFNNMSNCTFNINFKA